MISISFFVLSTEAGGTGCPGIGIDSSCPTAFWDPKIRLSAEDTWISTYDTGEDFLQPFSCTDSFDLPAVHAIFELEERLADWVRKGDSSRVYKGDVPYSPSLANTTVEQASKNSKLDAHHKYAGNVTPQCPSTQEQTSG